METIGIIMIALVVTSAPVLWLLLAKKRSKKSVGRIRHLLPQGPRRRDGAVTYDEFRGVRFNIELEDPRAQPGARYQRRHSGKRHKQTKPWMK